VLGDAGICTLLRNIAGHCSLLRLKFTCVDFASFIFEGGMKPALVFRQTREAAAKAELL
jgi:hypothetical protein